MRSRRALPVLAALLLPVVMTALAPAERGFDVKGDEATYVAMALSVAYDADLRFTANDLHRFEHLYDRGPDGIFLQRPRDLHVSLNAGWPPIQITSTPRAPREGLAFGKPFVYAIVAAPFVRLLGLRGLLLLNLLLLSAIVWMGWMFASTRLRSVPAAVLATAFVCASIVALYSVWRTPEVLNVALVFGGYFLWSYKYVAESDASDSSWLLRPASTDVGVALLGLATFSKPPNLLLVAPVVATALLSRRWRQAIVATVVFVLFSAGAFGVNALISGEPNYQGGDRKTFYGRYPYSDSTATFDQMGSPMVTENTDAESLLSPSVFWPLFEHNAVYFFIGRDAGLIPYFFPGFVLLVAWCARPREWTAWQVFALLALTASVLALLTLAPYTWNGGGGPPGNRYFLSLYPVLFFLLPTRVPRWVPVASLAGFVVTAPLLGHPAVSTHQPWLNVEHGVTRLLPVELTLVDDLPVRLAPLRSRITLADSLMYLLDQNAFFPEGDGFWTKGNSHAEIIVRTDRAIERATFELRSIVPNHVTITMGKGRTSVDLKPNTAATVLLAPGGGVVYTNGSRAYVLTLTTSNGFVPRAVDRTSTDDRFLGVFVRPVFRISAGG